jgi:conjugal transfer pilin signal peptidase TrbI
VALSLTALYAGTAVPQHFAITLSNSLRYRLFFLYQSGSIKKGQYVVFALSDSQRLGLKIPDGHRLVKEVVCTEGDRFKSDGENFYCNSHYLGRAMKQSQRKLSSFVFDGVVPEGCLAVFGHSQDSFDSRYFGFIKEQEVYSAAWPLW